VYRSTEALYGPILAASVENIDDVIPAVLWAQLPNDRKPGFRRGIETIDIKLLACLGRSFNRFRAPFPKTGVARKSTLSFCCLDTFSRALGALRLFKFYDRAENLDGKGTQRPGRVDGITERSEADPSNFEFFN